MGPSPNSEQGPAEPNPALDALRDGVYITVGLAVLGVIRAQQHSRVLEERLPPEARAALESVRSAVVQAARALTERR
ncbi:MAG: hypothetical protein ACKVWR_06555 [Acidimicrobiales bacterium]